MAPRERSLLRAQDEATQAPAFMMREALTVILWIVIVGVVMIAIVRCQHGL